MSPTSLGHVLSTPIRYVFYRILSWRLRDAHETTPVLVAALLTALVLYLNALFLLMVIRAIMHSELLPALPQNTVPLYAAGLVALVAWISLASGLWVNNGGYQALEHEFGASAGRPKGNHGTVLFWIYIAGSIIAPILMAFVWQKT
jgi:hypothetical protein